ncbi:MAG: protein kinase [Thermoanaerobaculia bacterium]
MGAVYLAEDTDLERKVALKILPEELAEDPDRLERFRNEAKTVARLKHPNIVTIYLVEKDAGVHFLTMEYVEGRTLGKVIPASGLSLQEFLKIAVPLSGALAAAHEQGVTHRDLKPANIMFDADDRVKVLDFGLAKLQADPSGLDGAEPAATALTRDGVIVGTPKLYVWKMELGDQSAGTEIERWARQALAIDERDGAGWAALFNANRAKPPERQADPAEAQRWALRAASLAPDSGFAQNAALLSIRSAALFIAGSLEIAERFPMFPVAKINAAEALTILERPAEALDLCDQALMLEPDNPYSLFIKTYALIHLEQLDEATASFARVEALAEDGLVPASLLEALRWALEVKRDDHTQERATWSRIRTIMADADLPAALRESTIYTLAPTLARAEYADRAPEVGLEWADSIDYTVLTEAGYAEGLRRRPDYELMLDRARKRLEDELETLEAADLRGELPDYLRTPVGDLRESLGKADSPI